MTCHAPPTPGPAQAFVLFAPGYLAGVIVHEAAHALTSWACGLHPRLVTLGIGPPRLRLRLGGVWVVVRGWPSSGSVRSLPLPAGRPWAVAALHLSGGAANLAVAALLAGATGEAPRFGPVLWVVVASQLAIAASTLVPLRWSGRPNDMLSLILLLRHPADRAGEAHRHMLALSAQPPGPWDPPPARSPDLLEVIYQWQRADRLTEPWACRDAAAVLARPLRAGRLLPAERAFVLGFLAATELTLDGPGASVAQLDAWSAEALALAPTPTVQVTRGGVLVLLDRPSEARAALLAALPGPLRPTEDALARAYLAMADAALGDTAAARAWLSQVRCMGSAAGLDRLVASLAASLPPPGQAKPSPALSPASSPWG